MAEDKGLWAALKQRKVIRTLGIYLAGSWLVLQIGNLVVDIWQLPDWTIQGLFILLVIGLPLTAVLAWRYDISEHGPVITKGAGLREILTRQSRLGRFGIAVTALLLTLVILFGMLHLWPDAELDPRIRHILASPVESDSDPNNPAYLLYGFNAPAGRDPYEYGRFITETYETLGSIPKNPEPLKFTLEPSDRWGLTRRGAAGYFAVIDSIPTILAANRELMERYERLRKTPVFSEVIRPTINSPIVPIQQLLLAEYLMRGKITYECIHGNAETAWNEWHAELTLRRSLLASANHILMKMIALNMVSEITRLRVLLLPRCPSRYAGPPVQRLTLPERSVISPMRFEFIAELNFLFDARDRSELAAVFQTSFNRFMFRILPFRRNATANDMANLLDYIKASLMDTGKFVEWAQSVKPFHPSLLEYLNNGAGLMIINGEETIDWNSYTFRLRELDRIILLSQVGERMLADGVKAEQANGWLTALHDDFRDPFTGKRPVWSNGMLNFPNPDIKFKFGRGLDLPLPQ